MEKKYGEMLDKLLDSTGLDRYMSNDLEFAYEWHSAPAGPLRIISRVMEEKESLHFELNVMRTSDREFIPTFLHVMCFDTYDLRGKNLCGIDLGQLQAEMQDIDWLGYMSDDFRVSANSEEWQREIERRFAIINKEPSTAKQELTAYLYLNSLPTVMAGFKGLPDYAEKYHQQHRMLSYQIGVSDLPVVSEMLNTIRSQSAPHKEMMEALLSPVNATGKKQSRQNGFEL
jgi:hypothetical protein